MESQMFKCYVCDEDVKNSYYSYQYIGTCEHVSCNKCVPINGYIPSYTKTTLTMNDLRNMSKPTKWVRRCNGLCGICYFQKMEKLSKKKFT